MSAQAEHLYALKLAHAALLERPSRHPQWEHDVMHAEWRVRAWAEFIIGWGC
ncbi:hypothetical protein [Diaphorobacter sp.]|uniref:hypothetical protein n=1 Tax=Diaphorobacter sp. TaxID=1934310 RepID=UPI00258C24FE|nr:hypothetical protein [Diaphorobacter sp.]